MTAQKRWGLITGIIGLIVNTLASLTFAFCGPIVAFGIGIIAGAVVTRKEPASSKGEGTQQGAITGIIAGALIFLGRIVGSINNLVYAQMPQYESIFGTLPDLSSREGQTYYWLVGIGVGVLLGLVDALACVLGSAMISYIRTPTASKTQEDDN